MMSCYRQVVRIQTSSHLDKCIHILDLIRLSGLAQGQLSFKRRLVDVHIVTQQLLDELIV